MALERRDAAQVIFISLKMNAELLQVLCRSRLLGRDEARPLVAQINGLSEAWRNQIPWGPEMIEEALIELRAYVGL